MRNRLERVRTLVTHGYPEGPCPDGMAAALLVRDALPSVDVRFIIPGSREHEELPAEEGLLFVDVTPPARRNAAFVASEAIVLDHHASARGVVEAHGELGQYEEGPGISGATLAYGHVWRVLAGSAGVDECVQRASGFARLAGIRDSWHKTHALWRAASAQAAALTFYATDSWPRQVFSNYRGWELLEERLRIGEPLLERKERDARKLAESALTFRTDRGTSVAVLGTTFISDAADFCEVDVVVGFSFRADRGVPRMKLSFRSRGEHDVSKIASALGGGGHVHSAGAEFDLESAYQHPYQVVRNVMSVW